MSQERQERATCHIYIYTLTGARGARHMPYIYHMPSIYIYEYIYIYIYIDLLPVAALISSWAASSKVTLSSATMLLRPLLRTLC